jgi:hypothetical protein
MAKQTGVSLRVDVDRDLLKKLNDHARESAKIEIGNNAVGIMQAVAPVKSGALRNSLNYETDTQSGTGTIPLPAVTDNRIVRAGSAIVYAAKNEFEYGNSFVRVSIPQIERDSRRLIEDNYRRQLAEA